MGGDPSVCDQRATPRYSAAGVRARLSWKVGDAYQTIDVRLKDISMGGVSATAAAAPPAGGPLWISLDAGPDDVWAEVALVAVTRERLLFLATRGYALRMRFTNGCGYDFFKRAIRGFASELVSRRTATEDLQWFNTQCWR